MGIEEERCGPHLSITVRQCVGSMNGLVGFAGATAQDVGRVEAGGRGNGVVVKAGYKMIILVDNE